MDGTKECPTHAPRVTDPFTLFSVSDVFSFFRTVLLVYPEHSLAECWRVCVFPSNLNLVLRTIVYSVVKVLPRVFIRKFRCTAPLAFRRSCI